MSPWRHQFVVGLATTCMLLQCCPSLSTLQSSTPNAALLFCVCKWEVGCMWHNCHILTSSISLQFRYPPRPPDDFTLFAKHSSDFMEIHVFLHFPLNSWKWKMKTQLMCFNNRRAAGFNQPHASPLLSWTPPSFPASVAHSACFSAARLKGIPRRRSFSFLCYT